MVGPISPISVRYLKMVPIFALPPPQVHNNLSCTYSGTLDCPSNSSWMSLAGHPLDVDLAVKLTVTASISVVHFGDRTMGTG